MTETITFRTSRGERGPIPRREGDAVGEAVIPLALHRPLPEAALTQARQAAAPERLPPVDVPAEAPAADLGAEMPVTGLPQGVGNRSTEIALRPRGRLYLVARSRGGVGATTFAVNLALGLCQKGGKAKRRVAIVDMDLQFGTVASCLDLTDRGGMLGLAQLDREPDGHAVSAALQTHVSGLSVLPAPRQPIPLDALDVTRVNSIVEALLSSHDAVIVDLPPALVDWLEPMLRRAERVFMLTDLAVTSIDCTKRILDTFREDAPDLRVEIVVGREKKPLFAGKLHREIAAALDQPLRHWLPFDPKQARLALDRGEPLVQTQPNGALARGIRSIIGGLE